MAKVEIGKSVTEDFVLWRYITFDKLKSLLERKSIFFCPLARYIESDPFEGYSPLVSTKAISSIFGKEVERLKEVMRQVELMAKSQGVKLPINFDSEIDKLKQDAKIAHKTIGKGILVNCWHASSYESEAMWKLYSKEGKGVAIKTTVNSLKNSMSSCDQDILVRFGMVKYMDFYDENLLPKDCLVDGHIIPLIKRLSYSHEKELRLFIVPNFGDIVSMKSHDFQPVMVEVSPHILINQIYISPLSESGFIEDVMSLSKEHGFGSDKVIHSDLLKDNELFSDITATW